MRVVAVGTSVVADPAARMPGRGAYLHPDLECLAAAERRRAFGRALRVPAPLDTTALHDALAGAARSEEPPPRAAARSVRPVEASGAPRGASTGSVRRQVEKR
ncbi:hypothetical protein EV189_2374 [Motilibacter rhizosphaerae]|uniref:YlxR domain-containing protein n=1 Tax=Motilibacter rhizosphaerae TaxID=598652 RepID=A0A4Q7NNY5_9ACTN|nr:hypothetical protein EV189_2374 [Motilibacter rhizosphaerae]